MPTAVELVERQEQIRRDHGQATEEEALLLGAAAVGEEADEADLLRVRAHLDLLRVRDAHLAKEIRRALDRELDAAAGALDRELAEQQREAVEKAKAATGPKVGARAEKALDCFLTGLETLQAAHHARRDRLALRAAFGFEQDDPIEPVPPLEREVSEILVELKRRIGAELLAATDRTAGVAVGRVPHRLGDEVAKLLKRQAELLEAE